MIPSFLAAWLRGPMKKKGRRLLAASSIPITGRSSQARLIRPIEQGFGAAQRRDARLFFSYRDDRCLFYRGAGATRNCSFRSRPSRGS